MRGQKEHIKGKKVNWLTWGFQNIKSTSPLMREVGAFRMAGDAVGDPPSECWPKPGAQSGLT